MAFFMESRQFRRNPQGSGVLAGTTQPRATHYVGVDWRGEHDAIGALTARDWRIGGLPSVEGLCEVRLRCAKVFELSLFRRRIVW